MAGIGHNSQVEDEGLLQLFERIERLEEEKKGIADDIKEVFSEAKARGYDTKIMRQILRLRKMKARMGRNPQTGEAIKIPARKKVGFTVSKVFKDSVLGPRK